jgi:hypothetical protein
MDLLIVYGVVSGRGPGVSELELGKGTGVSVGVVGPGPSAKNAGSGEYSGNKGSCEALARLGPQWATIVINSRVWATPVRYNIPDILIPPHTY